MTDIVERLKEACVIDRHYGKSVTLTLDYDDYMEAADEITRLRAGNERLRAKIEHLSKEVNYAKYGNPDFAWSLYEAQMNDLRLENERLRAALRGMIDNACAACDEDYVIRATKKEWDAHVNATAKARAALEGKP